MSKRILYIILALSVITNIIILFFFQNKEPNIKTDATDQKTVNSPFADYETRQQTAEKVVRKLVCDNLYYPNSYDPVNTQVDSAFYSCLTDADCVTAAIELIDMQSSYDSAKDRYDENLNNIRTFGGSGVFRDFTIAKNEAKKEMIELKPKIERRKSIIKNRNCSKDGEFIGWQIIHKYRASNSNGVVSFGNELYILDPQMEHCFFRYSLEQDNKKNLNAIITVIQKVLGIYIDK